MHDTPSAVCRMLEGRKKRCGGQYHTVTTIYTPQTNQTLHSHVGGRPHHNIRQKSTSPSLDKIRYSHAGPRSPPRRQGLYGAENVTAFLDLPKVPRCLSSTLIDTVLPRSLPFSHCRYLSLPFYHNRLWFAAFRDTSITSPLISYPRSRKRKNYGVERYKDAY